MSKSERETVSAVQTLPPVRKLANLEQNEIPSLSV